MVVKLHFKLLRFRITLQATRAHSAGMLRGWCSEGRLTPRVTGMAAEGWELKRSALLLVKYPSVLVDVCAPLAAGLVDLMKIAVDTVVRRRGNPFGLRPSGSSFAKTSTLKPRPSRLHLW
ncbi:unnamed protein product, partial [Gadus morhua 'NCC']